MSQHEGPAILFVDDEDSILAAIRRSIGKDLDRMGLAPFFASAVSDVWEMLPRLEARLAVLVTDQRMPGTRGSELAASLRERCPDLVTIVLSGYSDGEDVASIVAAGVQTFVAKPWEPPQLLHAVEAAYRTSRLHRDARLARDRAAEDLAMAADFQREVLSIRGPGVPGLDLRITRQPAPDSPVTGDFLDVIPLGNRRFVVITGDVAGHGMKTALLTVMLKAIIGPEYFRGSGEDSFAPARFLGWLNRRLCRLLSQSPELFVTCSATLVDLPAMRLEHASAGQPPLVLVRDGRVHSLDREGLVLGVDSDSVYRGVATALNAGDELLFCSDGVYPAGIRDSGLDPEGFVRVVGSHAGALSRHEALLSSLADAAGTGGDWEDDVTLLTFVVPEPDVVPQPNAPALTVDRADQPRSVSGVSMR